MSKKLKTVLCLCTIALNLLCLVPSMALNVEAKPEAEQYVPGEVIIGLKDASVASFEPVLAELGATVEREIPGVNAAVIHVAAGSEESFMQNVEEMPGVAYVERNGMVQATFVPNDTYWPLQWNMPMIKANASWDTYQGWKEITIAILDTGVNYTHPDLAANYQPGGYDWVNDDGDPMDDHNHGTHCAGIAAAVLDNARGVAGVAQVKIWAEKVLNASGWGNGDDLASALIHATDKGVNVISISLGSYRYSSLVDSACSYAYDKGVLLVAGAGNDNANMDIYPFYPACYSTVIAVSATTSSDVRWALSNYGSAIEMSAPGESIYSTTKNGNYGYRTGTSMACPHVAGLAALIWSYQPQLTRTEVRSKLQTAVDDKGAVGKDIYYGYGRINCQKAITDPVTYAYRFGISGFLDRVWINVSPQPGGTLLYGKVNVTVPWLCYPAQVLGWRSGNNFYMAFDFRTTPGCFEQGFLVGTVSTKSGKLYRTNDGVTWTGPTKVTLTSFAETAEEQTCMAEDVEQAAVQYVEGLNPTRPVDSLPYSSGWYAIRYVPSTSYPLKKIELMAGGKGGNPPFVIQLRPDNGTGYPSNIIYRQVTFAMSNTVGWQGAEFDTSFLVVAGTPYWVTFQPPVGSTASTATKGTLVTHCWDNFGDGTGDWDYKGTSRPWMAKFYKEVQTSFMYNFRLSPYIARVYLSTASQLGGALLHGLTNVTSAHVSYPATGLGWGSGNSFYWTFDYRTNVGSGAYELGFVVGTISTKSGKLYRTTTGETFTGPVTVTLTSSAEVNEKAKPSAFS